MAAFPYRDMESSKASFCASIASKSTLIPGIGAHLTSDILAKFINKTINGGFEFIFGNAPDTIPWVRRLNTRRIAIILYLDLCFRTPYGKGHSFRHNVLSKRRRRKLKWFDGLRKYEEDEDDSEKQEGSHPFLCRTPSKKSNQLRGPLLSRLSPITRDSGNETPAIKGPS